MEGVRVVTSYTYYRNVEQPRVLNPPVAPPSPLLLNPPVVPHAPSLLTLSCIKSSRHRGSFQRGLLENFTLRMYIYPSNLMRHPIQVDSHNQE